MAGVLGPLGAAGEARFFLANRSGGGRSTADALFGIRCSWSGDVFIFVSDTGLSVLFEKKDTSVAISFSVEVDPEAAEAARADEALTGVSPPVGMNIVLWQFKKKSKKGC